MVHCAVAVDSEIRRENFKRWCHSLTPDGLFSPSAVAQRLGKTASQWSDLYYGRKSFGEKIARNIEEAAGLPLLIHRLLHKTSAITPPFGVDIDATVW